jgi:8-oxo-dGTP pyrophosphatase MutT (NUDIX family)/DNA-binding XRE family transcriptional regulator
MSQPARDAVIDQWTGRHATALQAAMRMSQDEMAALIGVSKRTIAAWSERPEIVIRPELQRALDTAYERAGEPVKLRFVRQLKAEDDTEVAEAGSATALTVAIAVVVNDDEVLLVCRREVEPGLEWQFPAGVVKPAAKPAIVATRETLAETGIHCSVSAELGSRIHPMTGAHARYFLCDYLAGGVENRDVIENTSALWAPKREVTRFIPRQRIFPPVLHALEESNEPDG